MSEAGNGWGEYQKLVLAELERHNKWLNVIDSKLNQALVSFTLSQQLIQSLTESQKDLVEVSRTHEKRIEALEKDAAAEKAVSEREIIRESDKKWLIGVSITAVVSTVGLILNILLKYL